MKKTILFLISGLIITIILIYFLLLSCKSCPTCTNKIEISADLSTPIDFGCPKDSSLGKITFISCEKNFQGQFTVNNLLPNLIYLLSINGKIGEKSNKLIMKKYQTTDDGREGFSDFKSFKTDNAGNFSGQFVLELLCGEYDVKIFIKDKNNQYCVVLMNQTDIKFTIEK